MIVIADLACVCSIRRRLQLITPILATVCLSSVGNVGCRLFGNVLYLINDFITQEEIYGTAFA